jgi:plastocyanin
MSSLRLAVVAFVLMSAVACGSNSPSPAPAPTPTPTPTPTPGGTVSSVTIPRGAETLGNKAFSPDAVDVAAGTTVTWTNTDVVTHTSTSDSGAWNSGSVGPNGQFSFTFATAGTFPYHCTIHPGMVGTVTVH